MAGGAVRKNFIFGNNFRKWAWNLTGFNQYGLYHDDLLMETPIVEEALKRLPTHLVDERQFRMIRALQLDCQKIVLPKEQWTKFEDDITVGRYLQPYIDEIEKELKEKADWNKE